MASWCNANVIVLARAPPPGKDLTTLSSASTRLPEICARVGVEPRDVLVYERSEFGNDCESTLATRECTR